MMILIPIIVIGGIFVTFYLFKDKFTGKRVEIYNEANRQWTEDKEAIVQEIYTNESKFGMLQAAVGDHVKIEAVCPCEPKKSMGKKLLKGGLEVLTSRQTFDMSLYFMVIAGGELHYLQSNGEMIVSHDAFTLNNLRRVDIRPEDGMAKVAGFLTSNDSAAQSSNSIFFESNSKDYSFRLLDLFQGYAKFEVEKGYSNGKHGQNPFYRVYKSNEEENAILTTFYGPETIATFKKIMLNK